MSSPQLSPGSSTSISASVWVLFVLAVMVVTSQVALKLVKHRSLEAGEWLLIIAVLVALGQSIAVTEAVVNGLGKDTSTITPSNFLLFEQAVYASQILYIGAVGLAKMGAAYAASRISTAPRFINTGRVLMVVSALWTATGLVSTALQCSPLNVASQIFSNQCFDQVSFWEAIGSIDLILDVAIAALASYLAFTLDMPLLRKSPFMLAFGSRLLGAPFLITNMVLISRTDRANPMVTLTIVTQAHMSIAIFTTCLPYLRLCSSQFERGLVTTNMRIAIRRKASKANKLVNLAPIQIRAPDRRHLDPSAQPGRHLSVRGSLAPSVGSSGLGSAKMIINKMTTFWVEEERAPQRESRAPPVPNVPRIEESFLEDP